jgi:hypothetical protein
MIVLDEPNPSQETWKNPEDVIRDGYNFQLESYISQGIQMFKKDIGNFVLFTLVFFAISAVINLLPVLGTIAGIIINPPLTAGYFLVADKIRRGEAYTFNNFFDGFKLHIGNLIVLSLVSSLLTGIGMVFCILPGIYLAVSYGIAVPMLIFLKLEFWDSMEASRKVIGKNFFSWLGFFIVVWLGALIIGVLACGVGLLFTIPVAILATYCAFVGVMSTPTENNANNIS